MRKVIILGFIDFGGVKSKGWLSHDNQPLANLKSNTMKNSAKIKPISLIHNLKEGILANL